MIGLLDGIIRYDYWMVFVSPQYGVCCRPFLAGAFFSPKFGVCCAIFLAGAFFFLLRVLAQKCHMWSKKVIYGPDVLKMYAIWSDVVICDLPNFQGKPIPMDIR